MASISLVAIGKGGRYGGRRGEKLPDPGFRLIIPLCIAAIAFLFVVEAEEIAPALAIPIQGC